MAYNIKRRLIYNREFYFLVFHYYIIFSIFKEMFTIGIYKTKITYRVYFKAEYMCFTCFN